MEDSPQKPAHFKPAMPRIPGVTDRPSDQQDARGHALRKPSVGIAALVVAALVLGGAIALWTQRTRHQAAAVETPPEAFTGSSPSAPPPSSLSASADRGVEVATVEELGKPWTSKKFLFRKPFGGETAAAMVVRLPVGAANDSASYWAFSLQAPFERCELEYVTDLHKLASQYGYAARHPMVANPCSSTLYDPLRLGTLPNGAWARGEVVQGSGIRPPVAIETHLRAGHLVATRIE